MARARKNVEWVTHDSSGNCKSIDHAILSVLMDVREELQAMRNDLATISGSIRCRNFQRVPAKLDRIGRATVKLAAALEQAGKA